MMWAACCPWKSLQLRLLWTKLSIIDGDSIVGEMMRLTQIFMVDPLPVHGFCCHFRMCEEKVEMQPGEWWCPAHSFWSGWAQERRGRCCLPAGVEQEQKQQADVCATADLCKGLLSRRSPLRPACWGWFPSRVVMMVKNAKCPLVTLHVK